MCGAPIRGPALMPDPYPQLGPIGAVRTVVDPCVATRCEIVGKLRTAPRGIPNPADPCVIITRRPDPPLPNAFPGTLPTITVFCPPLAGGVGGTNARGGFATGGTVFHVVQPPGNHPQPKPGTNAHVPYRYGIHPHGYADTHEYPYPGYQHHAPFMNGFQPNPVRYGCHI